MSGLRALQAFRRGPRSVSAHRALSQEYRHADVWAISLDDIDDPALALIGTMTVAALLAVDGHRMLSGDLAG